MTKKDIPTDPQNSILSEAHSLVHGDRNSDYGHPYTDYKRTSDIFNAMTGRDLSPWEACLFMVCVKLSRMQHKTKRDTYVDAAGYLEVLRMVEQVASQKQKPQPSGSPEVQAP